MKTKKRSNHKIITLKSKTIRYMRLSMHITQSFAAEVAGCSKAAIGHYETGRMDISDDRLRRLLAAYGETWESFHEYLNGKAIPILDLKDECFGLLDRIANEDKLRAVHTVLQSFIS